MSILEQYSDKKLETLAHDMGIKTKTRQKMIDAIKKELTYKFVKVQRLGRPGKDGITYRVFDKETENYYAMKTFKKTKSINVIRRECEFQKRASEMGISPRVIYLDEERMTIVMEEMEYTLLDLIRKQDNKLTTRQQTQLLNLFYVLDELKIFHNDPNPCNIMIKYNTLYIIDFGLARKLTTQDYKNYGKHPNKSLMCLGLLIWLKKLGINCKNMGVLMDNVSQQSKIDYQLLDSSNDDKKRPTPIVTKTDTTKKSVKTAKKSKKEYGREIDQSENKPLKSSMKQPSRRCNSSRKTRRVSFSKYNHEKLI